MESSINMCNLEYDKEAFESMMRMRKLRLKDSEIGVDKK